MTKSDFPVFYSVKDPRDHVFRTKFNLSQLVGKSIGFTPEATGLIYFVLDRGVMRMHGGHPTIIELFEEGDLKIGEIEVYAGDDWWNPALKKYFELYEGIRAYRMKILDENTFEIEFTDDEEEDYQKVTPNMIVKVGEIPKEDQLKGDDAKRNKLIEGYFS